MHTLTDGVGNEVLVNEYFFVRVLSILLDFPCKRAGFKWNAMYC
jgi:hypothetical protein